MASGRHGGNIAGRRDLLGAGMHIQPRWFFNAKNGRRTDTIFRAIVIFKYRNDRIMIFHIQFFQMAPMPG